MKTATKAHWLLALLGLLAILLPYPALAQKETTQLSLMLVGDRFPNGVKPEKDNIFYLEVRNTGHQPITSVKLSADAPDGWIVEFKPDSIDRLAPGNSQMVDVNIRPPKNASRGGYTVVVIAGANETRDAMSIFTRVETTATLWLWIGIAVALVVIAAFVIIFVRSNRQ